MRKSDPMVTGMIKGDIHVELTLWPVLQVKIVAGEDVDCYELRIFRMTEPFVAVSEICRQHSDELRSACKYERIEMLKELELITRSGGIFLIHQMQTAGRAVTDFRRLEVAA